MKKIWDEEYVDPHGENDHIEKDLHKLVFESGLVPSGSSVRVIVEVDPNGGVGL
jgi:hypothetical protein